MLQGRTAVRGGAPCADTGALGPAATIADRTRRAIRQHPVDDHVGDADAGAAKRPQTVFAFGDRQQFRKQHPAECRAERILEQRTSLLRLSGQERNQAIGRVRTSDARELLADQTVLALQPLEHVGDRGDGGGGGEQAQRVSGRRRVDDDQMVIAGVRQPDDLEQRHQLVDAGDGQCEQRIDVVAIEPGAVLENFAEGVPVIAQPSAECPRAIELNRREGAPSDADGAGRADSRTPSASPSECAGSTEIASTRRPARASAIAHAAAHVVLPTPPLPAKKANSGTVEIG